MFFSTNKIINPIARRVTHIPLTLIITVASHFQSKAKLYSAPFIYCNNTKMWFTNYNIKFIWIINYN